MVFLFALSLSAYNSEAQTIIFSKTFIKVRGTSINLPSAIDTLLISHSGFNSNPKFVCSFPFQISTNGMNFNDTLIITSSQNNIPIYIRTLPNQSDQIYRGALSILDGNFILNNKVYLLGSSILPSESISMCTWNLKWFGSPTYCNCDTVLARVNTTAILKELESDVLALQEVVSISQLERVVSDLGGQYDYVIADYSSQIPNANTTGYVTAQKQAFIYNKQKFTKLSSYGLLRSTFPSLQGASSPYYYHASGRWPYGLKLKANTTNEEFNFINLHSKAFAGSSEHNRRAGGALKMTDSLNTHLANQHIIILGDYNDLLQGAITPGFTMSPYDYALNNGFKAITLPALFPGETTYLGATSSLIDNYMLSNKTHQAYIPNSTLILREADLAISNYKNTTSDHLPVLSFLRLNGNTSIRNKVKLNRQRAVLVQPNGNELHIQFPIQKNQFVLGVYAIDGKELFKKEYSSGSSVIRESLSFLKEGLYIVKISDSNYTETHKWIVN